MADYSNEIDYANMMSNYENAEGDDSDEYTEDSSSSEDGQEGSFELDGGGGTLADSDTYEQATDHADDDETYGQETEAGVSTQYTSVGEGKDKDDDDEYTSEDTEDDSSSSSSSDSSSDNSDDASRSDNDTNEFESADSDDNDEASTASTPVSVHNDNSAEASDCVASQQSVHQKDARGIDPAIDSVGDFGQDERSSQREASRESLDQEKESSHSSDCAPDQREEDDFEDEFDIKNQRDKGPRRKKQQSPESSNSSKSKDEFEDEIVPKKKKKKKKKKEILKRRRAENSPLDQERDVIAHREKLLTEREGNVNTRERRFTRWIIALAVLICLGAGALVALYFLEPFGGEETSKQEENVGAPTADSTSPPAPTLQPSVAGQTTSGPTGPDVVASFSFLGLVPGDENASAASVEENLVATLNDFAPDILASMNDQPPAAETREAELIVRRYLKALSVRIPVSVNVTEIGKLHRIDANIWSNNQHSSVHP
jgi:hypothetical protein